MVYKCIDGQYTITENTCTHIDACAHTHTHIHTHTHRVVCTIDAHRDTHKEY